MARKSRKGAVPLQAKSAEIIRFDFRQQKPAKAQKAKAPKKPRLTAQQRFDELVDTSAGPNACHPARKVKESNGYGSFHLVRNGTRITDAHRAAWVLANGDVPAGKCVLHNTIKFGCEKSCCNARHMYLGTNADNSRDASIEGKQRSGKLDGAKAAQIRILTKMHGMKPSALAVQFGVSRQSIINVTKNRTYTGKPRKGQRARSKVEHQQLELGAVN